jgi:hypothetical protein
VDSAGDLHHAVAGHLHHLFLFTHLHHMVELEEEANDE